MTDPAPPYTAEQLAGDDISKKDLAQFLQNTASSKFLAEHKLKGALKNVAKTKKKEELVAAYNELFETKAFKREGEEEEEEVKPTCAGDALAEKTAKMSVKAEAAQVKEPPKYKKTIISKGDKTQFPSKGDTVACFYTGKLQDGTVFDTNVVTGRKAKSAQPLRFQVGKGRVIRGWDEALMTMSVGEKAELTIQPEWAYGRKGLEGKIPPNSTLTFEVELVALQ